MDLIGKKVNTTHGTGKVVGVWPLSGKGRKSRVSIILDSKPSMKLKVSASKVLDIA